MNNVIDVMDSKEGGHAHALTEMQHQNLKEHVCATQQYERLCGDYLDDEDFVQVCDMKEAKLMHKIRLTLEIFS